MSVSFDDLPPEDVAILTRLMSVSDSLRASLVTLARLGVMFRKDDDARAARWIEILETHPFYKLGQVMFDLLEWEDFMLDGDPPNVIPTAVHDFANKLFSEVDLRIDVVSLPEGLPNLETGFYLYRDVVLGLIWLALEGYVATA